MNDSGIITHAPNIVGLFSRNTRPPSNLRDRARGVILGLAAGNLLGLDVEGWSRNEIAAQYPQGVTEINPVERNRPMDDDLAQAKDLAEALLQDGDYVQDFANRLVQWRHENGRGIGNTTAAVIKLLERGCQPPDAARHVYEDRNHIAPNGGIMRCASIALARRDAPQLLVTDSAATCAVTHYAPACQWSCIALNTAIALLLRGADHNTSDIAAAAAFDGAPEEVWGRLRSIGHHPKTLNLDQGLTGHTLLCLQAGMWALETPLTFESALIELVRSGGDTDTNGAVAGAVLGARYGSESIPRRWLDCIPQRERLEQLADDLIVSIP